MNNKILMLLVAACALVNTLNAQTEKTSQDTAKLPPKVLHAEPLYIDLIRDLGARKGEKEWNVGFGLTDKLNYDNYEFLVEYEWAPVNRLGLEVELPFTFYSTVSPASDLQQPANKLESLKVAAQWTFMVNEKAATSMAFGYINEFVLSDFGSFGRPLITANVFNPFLVVAKRWGHNFHTLIYTGPMVEYTYEHNKAHTSYDINTNIHYMIPNTRNFVGIEFNKTIYNNDFQMVMRPQMRVSIAHDLMVGIVAGIPISKESERLSSFIRLIWEPKGRKSPKY
ncbi:HAEPLYID family protein [Roseivirga pacifica]|uniref:HAEPLYID family protein n=1 Tax=Roseivirga pacifica TaxID=1267423 RepID=UPI0020941AAE|nr:HAEPLYID family protein [Roseivirga pacifica]MCO6358503.1 phosphoribosylformylglycinamidine synthase [Roseivirga pacifica]MCO6369058.1 phosphoribosylformylglycinamidine synthase [Roseivirga pacifica]MCO6372238.1 phosphoribosylformylglycinamidine synthase [Roseivirga pacifica]MCO6374234.1 phosphoribosylformylglycinamidine synthase [Roseivirga pacifica]MCO6380969.1 phosphoribosylformylglycinamidine synthase [Roseivirga pacifica]